MSDLDAIAAQLAASPGISLDAESARPVGGGCINAAWHLSGAGSGIFLKTNAPSLLPMFQAEAAGLTELGAAGSLRVPRPLATGVTDASAWIAMEWIEQGEGSAEEELGAGLAEQHRKTAGRFGWDRDNTIGSSPQRNDPSADWPDFFARHRLGFQLDLARQNGWGGTLTDAGGELCQRLPDFFSDYRPAPSLLHGDLWAGNRGVDSEGHPFLFDPAVYYGDREADIAMTELFGGFGADFYAAYGEAWPLDSGYQVRRLLYNLYHILNHLNLFGTGYLGRAQGMVDRLLAETRG
ncbi:MAG: fructosamine kinase family protein [Chromatiales bacterium]|jgi:fructosamine-3-kinase|nr:fructosamine kinase family protein [Chromatiales bacterium]